MEMVDRLLNLVAALIDTAVPMTAEEIRTRVPGYSTDSDEAFHRSFERDKDDLRELGVPIETVTVGHHEQAKAAYTIDKDSYELPDPGLEPDELAAIQLAATTVQIEGLDPDDVEESLRKLGGVAATEGAGGSPLGSVPTPGSLLDLFVAVLERRETTFRYGDNERRLQPHRLQFERGRWYVSGYDVDRSDQRSFRLDRITGTVALGAPDAFERPEEVQGVRLRPWELGEGPPTPTTVLLDADIARAVLTDDPGLEVTERRADGSVVVELAVRNVVSLRNFVLTLLDRAEILGPDEVRDDLVDWVTQFTTQTSVGRP